MNGTPVELWALVACDVGCYVGCVVGCPVGCDVGCDVGTTFPSISSVFIASKIPSHMMAIVLTMC
jgi:hypothetical protein